MGPPLISELVADFSTEKRLNWVLQAGRNVRNSIQIGVSDLSKSYINRPGRIYLKTKSASDLIWNGIGFWDEMEGPEGGELLNF